MSRPAWPPSGRRTRPLRLGTNHDTGRSALPLPAPRSQTEWTAIMCTHDPVCPAADAIDWWAARNITEQPGQGWTLLCNGALVFDDHGALLPDGRVTAISDVP